MGTLKTVLLTLAVILVLAVAGGIAILYSGAYNVAATESHWGVTRWALGTLQHRSVAARAGAATGAPPTDAGALAHGFEHFHAMCVECHGAPGLERGEAGKGMRPRPPRLERAAQEWTDGELFWITKHGIRLAGMPAFGPTHTDEEIWGIVGFIRELEGMTEADYAERVRARGGADRAGDADAGGHDHAEGTPAHEH